MQFIRVCCATPWPRLTIGPRSLQHYDGLDSFDDPTKRANGSVFSNDNTYGWGRLSFVDAENLVYEHVASGNSSVIDTQHLYKKRHGSSSSRKRLERIN